METREPKTEPMGDDDAADDRDDAAGADASAPPSKPPRRSSKPPKRNAKSQKRHRMQAWMLIALAVVIAALLLLMRSGSDQGSTAAGGTPTSANLTLVTADRNDLDCAVAAGVGTFQCGYSDEKTARQIDERNRLRPFMTIGDRRLYLIPGLFLEPAIAGRYATEAPTGKTRDKLKRFTAACKIKIVGELDGVKLRWSPSGAWEPPKKFPVATVSDCKIQG